MNNTFTFDGITKSYLVLERGWSLPAWAPIERQFVNIPGRPGAVQTDMQTGMRRFSVPIVILSKNDADKQAIVEDMAKWLIHSEAKPLVFSNQPDRTLYARIEGSTDFAQLFKFGEGTLNIVCADPYKYAAKKTNAFQTGMTSVLNEGTVPVPPVIKASVLSDITHLQVFDGERYFQIGEAAGVENAVKKREERLLNDPLESLVGWSSAGMSVDGGTVAGAMETNGFSFGASSYGTGAAWHGPAVKKSIPEAPITDFKIRMKFIFKNPSISARGRIECYLLDEQSADLGKFAMKRTGGGSYGNAIEARAGGGSDYKYFADFAGASGIEWRNFDGLMELSRIGNVWRVYTALVDPVSKKHTARAWFTHNDVQRKFIRNLAQIQLHIGKFGTTETADMRIGGLEVFRINPVTAEETEVMAIAGDEIELNFKTKKIYLNGELRPDLKSFGGNFFSLPLGNNTLMIEPASALNAEIEWEEGFR